MHMIYFVLYVYVCVYIELIWNYVKNMYFTTPLKQFQFQYRLF